MGSTIIDISGSKAVEMVNARFARKPVAGLFDGGAWTKIRVALYLDIDTTSSIANPTFYFGLCSGTTNIPGDATPTNAIGCWFNNAATLTYYNGAGTTSRQLFGEWFPRKNVGGVEASGTSFGNPSGGVATSDNTGSPSALLIDISKGSPNYTLSLFSPSGAITAMTDAQFATLANQTSPSYASYSAKSGATLAFSESAGTLDSAFIYWSPAIALRLRQWRVIKVA